MREPKKRQGSALKETSSRTRKRGRDAVNLSAEQGIAMHSFNCLIFEFGDVVTKRTNTTNVSDCVWGGRLWAPLPVLSVWPLRP